MAFARSIETLAVPGPAPPAVATPAGPAAASEEDLEFQEMLRNSAGAKILADWKRIEAGGSDDDLAVEHDPTPDVPGRGLSL